jgi:hypothetical protein
MTGHRDAAAPGWVAGLGYGGLLPFIGLACASWLRDAPGSMAGHALIAYGAVILSFVGALHWGFAMMVAGLSDAQRRNAFVWSVLPALMAWVALLLMPPASGILLVVGFLAHYARDRTLSRLASLPAWYLPLRLRLTMVACLCLAAGMLAALLQRPLG